MRQHPWSIRDQEPHPVRPATSDQARHPDSTVSDGRDDSPSGQLAVDSSIEQAAPPAGRGPRSSDTSLKIADSNVVSPNAGKTHKRPFEFIFDVFAESDEEAAVGCQKRSRCSDVVINDITDDDNVDDEPSRPPHRRPVQRRARPPRPARQTRGAQRLASRSHAQLVTYSVGRGESLAGTRWQVKEILGERQTDEGLKYEVIEGKGRETRTIWQYRADIDPEMLKGFKAGQRSTRYMVRSTPRR